MGSDVGDYEIEDEHGNILDEMIHSEHISLLRRELAFIKADYRNVVVAYYIENRSIREIAKDQSLSVSAVQLWKAFSPMLVTWSGMVISSSKRQPKNA